MSIFAALVESAAEATLRRAAKVLPLPISMPEPLERASGPVGWRELAGRTALLTRGVRAGPAGAGDAALLEELVASGAEVVVLDGAIDPALQRPWPSGGRIHAAEVPLEPEALSRALADRLRARAGGGSPGSGSGAGARPGILVHRVLAFDPARPGTAAEQLRAELDLLYAVGQAAARTLGPGSRVIFPIDGPGRCADASEPIRTALGTFARSLAKELGKRGTTVHAPETFGASSARGLAWLAGPRASFLSALTPRLGGPAGPGSPGSVDPAAARPRQPRPADDSGPRRLLEDRVVVVTGAARGIGAAIARACAREGAAIGLNDLAQSEKPAAEVLRDVRRLGVEAAFLPFDVATAEGARALVDAVRRQFGRVDVLVNNAGLTRDRTIARMKPGEWHQALDVNLGAALRVTEAALPLLAPGGAVIDMASVMGIAGNFGQSNYATAKAALIGCARVAARELAPRGITVNALAPGFIRTRLTEAMPAVNRLMATQLTALLQAGEPEDIAELVVFLAGPDGGQITGEVIRVDGGMAVGA